jgi:FHS family L-fucose permease-like MFS transporter
VFNALLAMVLAVVSSQTTGITAALAVLAIGLANSVMFPTVFTLALEGMGEDTSKGSALLCTAIVGGSVIPYVYGWAADLHGLALALLIPAACYLFIAGYGLFTIREPAALRVK